MPCIPDQPNHTPRHTSPRSLIVAMLAAGLAGCITTPQQDLAALYNVASAHVSPVDGSTTYQVQNIDCAGVVFDISHNTAHPGAITLLASRIGAANIGRGKSLIFNIDGQRIELASPDVLTRHTRRPFGHSVTRAESGKAYPVTRALITTLAQASDISVRLNGYTDYIQAHCTTPATQNQPYRIQAGFSAFLTLTP